MPEAVHYRVSMLRPHSHLFEVEATFPAGPDTLRAVLPVWTPGSYLVREFARQVQDVSATGPGGEPLAVQRVDKRTWHVQAQGRAVTLRYRVYANELTVRTSHLDGSHGYFNGATLFLYTEATRGLEHLV
ncbi:MAG: M61 family metallopeptidase, partial [Archangium sp.]